MYQTEFIDQGMVLGYIKVFKLKSPLSGLRQFLATESPFKMMRNASPQKFFSFSRYLSFFLTFWLFIETALLKRSG